MPTSTSDQTSPTPVRRRLVTKDLRERFRVSDVTLWRWQKAGKLPEAHFINGRKRWWSDEIEAADARLTAQGGGQ